MRLVVLLLLFPCAVSAQPVMDVLRGGTSVPDGGVDALNNTGTSPFNITYTVNNDGTTDLELNGTPIVLIADQTNCTVSQLTSPATPLAPSSGTTFTLQVSPVTAAAFSFTVSIDNNSAVTPYAFTFNGHPSSPPSGGGGGGSGSSGCTTDETQGWWWLLLCLAAMPVVGRSLASCAASRGRAG